MSLREDQTLCVMRKVDTKRGHKFKEHIHVRIDLLTLHLSAHDTEWTSGERILTTALFDFYFHFVFLFFVFLFGIFWWKKWKQEMKMEIRIFLISLFFSQNPKNKKVGNENRNQIDPTKIWNSRISIIP